MDNTKGKNIEEQQTTSAKKLSKIGEYLQNWYPIWDIEMDEKTLKMIMK